MRARRAEVVGRSF